MRKFVRSFFVYLLLISSKSMAMGPMPHTPSTAYDPLDPMTLTKFIDPLPIPKVVKPTRYINNVPYYEMTMSQFKQKMHTQIPKSTVWGYNGVTPGPVLFSHVGTPAIVNWINQLPTTHIFPLPSYDMIPDPAVRNVVHLHGGLTPSDSDGYPDSWFVPGQNAIYTYPNHPEGFYTFYHDHAVGITLLNVYAGLAGFFILRDPLENTLNLPDGKFSIPLMVQDKSFNKDGSLIIGSFYYNTAVVNGKVWPVLRVEPRKYRFRLLNACTARVLQLFLGKNAPIWQIGSDQGFLNKPQRLHEFSLSPAERVDLIIDFTNFAGKQIILKNSYNPSGLAPLHEIMKFKVDLPLSRPDTSSIPTSLRPYKPTKQELLNSAIKTRNLTLDGPFGPNFEFLLNMAHWEDPVTENPRLHTTEIWNLINLTSEAHPIHVHLVRFRIVGFTPIDVKKYKHDQKHNTLGPLESYFTGPAVPPAPVESGWKDVVLVPEGYVAQIVMPFEKYHGRYVWHCHILDHEDFDMMRPMEVLPAL